MRKTVLVLTCLTGASGLIYEVVWQRYLANLFGSHARASVLILAVFLGGLGLGYAAFGRLSKERGAASLLRAYGLAELGIAAWAFAFPTMFETIWAADGLRAELSSLGAFGDALLAALLIGAPTVLMGGTLPLLTRALARNLRDATRFHAHVYAVNTAGACLGALGAGFVLIPAFGLPLTMMGVAAVNAATGLVFLAMASAVTEAVEAPGVATASPGESASETAMGAWRACMLAFLGGAVSICLQTVVIRIVGLSVGSSEYAFSMVVAVFIAMLAAGAAIKGSGKSGALLRNQGVVILGLIVLYASVPYWPWVAHLARATFASNGIAFYAYYAAIFLLLAAVLSLPVGALGRSMPLLFGAVNRRIGSSGNEVGRLYGWNTLGCIAGATLGGYVALRFVNLDDVARFCIALATLAGMMMMTAKARLLGPALALVGALLAVVFLPPWPEDHLGFGLFRLTALTPSSLDGAEAMYRERNAGLTYLFYRDDPNTTVAVTEAVEQTRLQDGFSRSLVVNGKSDGSTGGPDRYTTILLGQIPALLQESGSDRAAVVGFGTGLTVGTLSLHGWVKTIDVIEISEAVRDAAPLFDASNHAASRHPKVTWHLDDAYRKLAASTERYGVIVSEPSNPWVTGVERLYTQEFYALMRQRLAEGGVFAQWFHTYSVSADTVGLVINTFATVFPGVRIFYTSSGDLLLLGSAKRLGTSAVTTAAARMAEPEVRSELLSLEIGTVSALLGYELWLAPAAYGEHGLQLLDFPKLSHRAGREFFQQLTGDAPRLAEALTLRPWTREMAVRTLLQESGLPLQEALPQICNVRAADVYNRLESQSWQCRSAAMSLAMTGKVDAAAAGDVAGIVLWLSGKDGGTAPADATPRLARRYIEAFADYESALLPLSAARLGEAAAPCLGALSDENVFCRGRYIVALALAGDGDGAAREMNRMVEEARAGKRKLPRVMLGDMREAVGGALRARESRNGAAAR